MPDITSEPARGQNPAQLNRPEALNALSMSFAKRFARHINELSNDTTRKCNSCNDKAAAADIGSCPGAPCWMPTSSAPAASGYRGCPKPIIAM
jgi:enoyl-CoA hydratase/carnithine racemase